VQDTFVQQRGQKFDKEGNPTGDMRDLIREGVLDPPLTGQKEVSDLGDPDDVGNAFYDDDLITTPTAYQSPTINLVIVAVSSGGIVGESATKRERGNVNSTISGTITKKYGAAILSSYTVEFQVNGAGTWTSVPGLSSISIADNPSVVTIPTTTHDATAYKTANSISYRLKITDSYQTTTSTTTVVSFRTVIFHGPTSVAPTDSTDVRTLPQKLFIDGNNPFILTTGTTEKIFTAAMPAPLTISEVIDLDALNIEITQSYGLSNFNVADAGGTIISYNVYTLSNAIAYSTSHKHEITRA